MLDTHIWVWHVTGDNRISAQQRDAISAHEESGLWVSAISCWEIAKLVELGRLILDRPVEAWLEFAATHPGIRIAELTPKIAAQSTQFVDFPVRDPADQIIAATAVVLGCTLLTADQRLLQYRGLTTL